MALYRCVLTVHDFFFYVSRESRVGMPLPYIHNTALLYAVGRGVPATQRLTPGNRPHYEEDIPQFRTYVTPAALLPDASGAWPEPVRISYNAIDTPLVFSMEKEKLLRGGKAVIPKFSAYYRYPPNTRFLFYAIGEPPPPRVRVGKKLVPARIECQLVPGVKRQTGRFQAAHPVNPLDLPAETRLEAGDLMTMPPVPLVVRAELTGPHLAAEWRGRRIAVALPDWERYRSVAGGEAVS